MCTPFLLAQKSIDAGRSGTWLLNNSVSGRECGSLGSADALLCEI